MCSNRIYGCLRARLIWCLTREPTKQPATVRKGSSPRSLTKTKGIAAEVTVMRPTFLVFFWVLKLHLSDETYAALFFDRLDKCRQKKTLF